MLWLRLLLQRIQRRENDWWRWGLHSTLTVVNRSWLHFQRASVTWTCRILWHSTADCVFFRLLLTATASTTRCTYGQRRWIVTRWLDWLDTGFNMTSVASTVCCVWRLSDYMVDASSICKCLQFTQCCCLHWTSGTQVARQGHKVPRCSDWRLRTVSSWTVISNRSVTW